MFKKSITAGLAVASLALAMGAFSVSAEARPNHWRHFHRWGGWHHHGGGWRRPVAVQRNCFWRRGWNHHHRVRVYVCRRAFY